MSETPIPMTLLAPPGVLELTQLPCGLRVVRPPLVPKARCAHRLSSHTAD